LIPLLLALGFGLAPGGLVEPQIAIEFFTPPDIYANTSHCAHIEGVTPNPVCVTAQNDLETVQSVIGGVSGLLQLWVSPILGKLSDAHGRRPLFIAVAVLPTITMATLLLVKISGMSMWIYFSVSFVTGFSPISIVLLSFVADVTTQDERPLAYSLILGGFSLTNLLALVTYTGMAAAVSPAVLLLIGVIAIGSAILYVFTMIPESHPVEKRKPFQLDVSQLDPRSALKIFLQPQLRMLAICASLFFFSAAALITTSGGYALFHFNLQPQQLGTLAIAGNVASLFVTLIVLPVSLRYFNEFRLLSMALLVTAGAAVFLSFAWTFGLYIVGSVFTAASGMVFPIISVSMSKRISKSDQGALDGGQVALTSISAAISGVLIGSVIFRINRLLGFFIAAGGLALTAFLVLRIPAYEAVESEDGAEASATVTGADSSSVYTQLQDDAL
jgi:DHA1 family tetracycline resistance protein-like MFS transporter